MTPTTVSPSTQHGTSWAWVTIKYSASRSTWTRLPMASTCSVLSTPLNLDRRLEVG